MTKVVLVALALSVVGRPGPLSAQTVRELGVQAIATASDPELVVVGLSGAIRPSSRARISLGLGAGVSDGEAAWRTELLGHFLLSPLKPQGTGFYAAGGVAAVAGPVGRSYLVLTFGLEERPGADSGWFVEAGVGGGARLAAGFRWRRFASKTPRASGPGRSILRQSVGAVHAAPEDITSTRR